MAALTLNSIRLCSLALGAALALAAPALAADVSVKLDAGTGFSVKNSTGASERLRVDETTGNISRNGGLFVHTTGSSNVFVGPFAGNPAATSSSVSAAFGYSALNRLTTGSGDSAFGNAALTNNTTGSNNVAVGRSALYYNTTGSQNSAVGFLALSSNTTASTNSAFGSSALRANTTGYSNTAVGQDALRFNTTGNLNSAVGSYALRANTTGTRNAGFGNRALLSNTTGSYNAAVGFFALSFNTTGGANSAFGSYALRSNTTADGNSAFGQSALRANTTGFVNSAFGNGALSSNTTGHYNSAFGNGALLSNTTGHYNSAFGNGALSSNTTGNSSIAFGDRALFYNTTGPRNVAVGYYAGFNQTTGSDNIYLANIGVAAESNTIRIGTPAPATPAGLHTRAFIAGIRGVTTGSANAIPVLIDSAGQLGTVSSSRSAKKEIRDMGDATARLLDLRPVTFRYKQQQTLPNGGELPPEYGLIAEEVADVFPDLVVYDESGRPFTVKYHEMAPMLLNEMKKQHAAAQQQQRSMEHVAEAQRREIAALTMRLARVETRVSGAPGEGQR